MSNIDYKAEVLKVYPDAKCDFYYDGRHGWYMVTTFREEIVSISSDGNLPSAAWQSAYDRLKEQGKIKTP